MSCLFHLLPIIFYVYFLSISTAVSGQYKETSYIYYLDPGRPSTWNNSNPEAMDGWEMTVLLENRNHTYNVGFYCGFYCTGNCSSYLFSIVAFGTGSHNVVWAANRNRPVRKNASVQLTSNEGLVLRDSKGIRVWSTNISGISVYGMNLTEEGNLVLFSNDEEYEIWQSFEHPTDTLLIGQSLRKGQKLVASSFTSFWMDGPFYATLTSDANFSAFLSTGSGQSMMYYSLDYQNSIPILGYEMQQLENFGISRPRYPLSYIEYVKLDTDGHLRIYQYFTREKSSTNVVDMVTSDCENISSNRYHLMQVRNIAYSISISNDAIEAGQQNTCLLACQRNCSCNSAVFIYENDVSNGTCYFPSEIVSVGEEQTTDRRSATFIRVLNPNGSLSPSPPEFIPPSPPFEPQPNLSPSPSPSGGDVPEILPPSSPPRSRKNLVAILSLSIAAGFIVIFIIITCLAMLRKKKLEDRDRDGDGDGDGEDNMKQVPGMLISFSYKDLEVATENFKEKLGTGGFGSVFKGILADGTRVAVKRLDKMSQGKREFLAEVETIGSMHHFNLVKLVGFCAEKSCRLLVYEYMTNGSLDNWIFSRDRSHTLDWQTRKKIILDIAKGLAYLHEDCRQKIIHLDIKPHNILLDENFNAKVSDFGLSTLIDRNESQVLTTMRGTPGYLAPEWRQLRVTVKVDVYSFGIVLLEIVTKRKNVDPSRSESSFHLLKMLQKKAEEEKLIDIVEDLDEEMEDNKEEVVRMIMVAAWCLQNDHTRRPLMSTVVKVLEGVMEVDQNIIYMFSHALASTSVTNDHMTVAPQASMLSAPR